MYSYSFQMDFMSVKNCCLYLELRDHPILVTEQFKERHQNKSDFLKFVIPFYKEKNPGANYHTLATLIGAKHKEVMQAAPGFYHFYQRQTLVPSQELKELTAYLQEKKIGWYKDPRLPQDWSVRKEEEKLVYRHNHQTFKTNRSVMQYLTKQDFPKEEERKIQSFVEEEEKKTKERQKCLKEMRKEKEAEWAEVVRKNKKRREDAAKVAGEEINPPEVAGEEINPPVDVEEEEEITEPLAKKRKV